MPFDEKIDTMDTEQEKQILESGRCYSGREIILLATEIEKIGRVFYKHAVKMASNDRIAEVFEQMAEDELGHIKTLHKKIAPKIVGEDEPEGHWESDEAVAQYLTSELDPDIFPDKTQIQSKLKSVNDEIDAVEVCLEGEKKAVAFYREIMSMTECNKGLGALKEILAEEEKHVAKLEQLKKDLS